MIGITKLLCGAATPGDVLRYGHSRHTSAMPAHLLQFSQDKKPIVVWNAGQRCNLKCVHCYADSDNRSYDGEMTLDEGLAFIQQLADFQVPVLLFSGGEPVMLPHLFTWAMRARELGIRTVLSTNGTLINETIARRILEADFGYVGVSLDGLGEVNDRFRGVEGAFDKALRGIRHCLEVGQRVGLRLTMTAHNVAQLPGVFELMDREGLHRICFYHLAYAGRGRGLQTNDVTTDETRRWVDFIFDRTVELHRAGRTKDVLTVDNHADGIYLYLRLLREDPARAEEVRQLLAWNGGNGSGISIAEVDWHGNVHPDQFTMHHAFGNVRQRPFGEIWTDTSHLILDGLKHRKPLLKGRCAACKWLDYCNGNLRVRAEAATGDFWASDPACYLTDEEIGLQTPAKISATA